MALAEQTEGTYHYCGCSYRNYMAHNVFRYGFPKRQNWLDMTW